MSQTITTHAWMNFPKARTNRVLDSILKRGNKNYEKAFQADSAVVYWNAESLGISRVNAYQDAPLAVQTRILEDCTFALLREAFAIERAGMAFAAKMVLLADDLQSRLLYSQFAAQEAAHYQAIAAYIPNEPEDLASDPFLSVLKDAIEIGGRMSLTLIIQVFLEGWGLLHYKKLQKDCLDPGLAEEFRLILQDEAHHHGSGVALLDLKEWSDEDRDFTLTTLKKLLTMVASGPWTIASILQTHLAPTASPTIFFKELRHHQETSIKLQQLRRILEVGGAETLALALAHDHAFTPGE